jgi:hypothetical protein
LAPYQSANYELWRDTLSKSKLEQRDAINIAKKLGADLQKDGAHQKAIFWHDGKLVLWFGIRHGRATGQGHLVGENHQLRLHAAGALALARCAMTKDQYIQHLKDRGVILE